MGVLASTSIFYGIVTGVNEAAPLVGDYLSIYVLHFKLGPNNPPTSG